MIKYIIVCLSFVFVSCKFSHKQEMGVANCNYDFSKVLKDTLITYELDGISLEGTETKVNYINSKITKSFTSVYGETGLATIIYEFGTDKIKVLETKYSYKSGIEKVKSNKDLKLDYKICYFIDFNGNLLGKDITERIDIFKEFKEAVPFEL